MPDKKCETVTLEYYKTSAPVTLEYYKRSASRSRFKTLVPPYFNHAG